MEELQEETSTPWWTIEGCVESEIAGKAQLIVYARPDSRHFQKVQWSTIQSGILAEVFAPGYDRYFFSLRSRKAWPGWASFDGKKLRHLREAGVDDLSQYSGIVEDNLIFYVPRPAMPALARKGRHFYTKLPTEHAHDHAASEGEHGDSIYRLQKCLCSSQFMGCSAKC